MYYRDDDFEYLDFHFRAANYLSAAQLFLRDNTLLQRRVTEEDLKSVVLGHWGCCPGVNFLYAHFSRFIRKTKAKSYLVLGSGHAAPALLANLYLEGSLGSVYSDLRHGREGLDKLIRGFGKDPRLQTEVSAALPGVMNAGGELGLALACATGSVLGNPGIVTFCVLGDGEMEAGSSMPSLLGQELLTPKYDGFLVLAINLNQYKMDSRSILSTWSNERLISFFSALKLRTFIADITHRPFLDVMLSVEEMYRAWESGSDDRLPVIILRSEKGYGAPSMINGKPFTGTHAAHKVGSLKCLDDLCENVDTIEEWLRSYSPEVLFQQDGTLAWQIERNMPEDALRLGRRLESDRKSVVKRCFSREDVLKICDTQTKGKGHAGSPMRVIGDCLALLLKRADMPFFVFCPDEASSNQLDALLAVGHLRGRPCWESSVRVSAYGRLIEILNETCCHSMLQGTVQTGRDGIYVTYESFAPITAGALSQYYKLLKVADYCLWREKLPSLKYVLTSLGWRNCYTHQNPDFLNTLLCKEDSLIEVYFPSDLNQAIVCLAAMFGTMNSIQVLVTGKNEFSVLRSPEEANDDVERGFWLKEWGKTRRKRNDVCLIAIGDHIVHEAIHACDSVSNAYPDAALTVLAPVRSRVLVDGSLKQVLEGLCPFRNIVVAFTGYTSPVRSLFSAVFDVREWIFRGYNDAFTLEQGPSVLENNGVGRLSLARLLLALLEEPVRSDIN
jgi:xylulose-5-phosphate/fructose-6-phosphate phosphoketolase